MTTQQQLISEVASATPIAKVCPACGTDFEFYCGWRLVCVVCGETPAQQQRTLLDSYMAHPPRDAQAQGDNSQEHMVGQCIWFHYLFPPNDGDDVRVHRISSVSEDETSGGSFATIYIIPHGDRDSRVFESWAGQPGFSSIRTGTSAPVNRPPCKICFPEGYRDPPSVE